MEKSRVNLKDLNKIKDRAHKLYVDGAGSFLKDGSVEIPYCYFIAVDEFLTYQSKAKSNETIDVVSKRGV